MKYIFLCVILSLILTACGGADTRYEQEAEQNDTAASTADSDLSSESSPEPPSEYTPVSGYSTDAAFLVETIETVHPIFLMQEMLPDTYESARASLLAIGNDVSQEDFVFAVRRYFATLQDGHMSGFGGLFRSNWTPFVFENFLDVEWVAENRRLFLADENGFATDTEVIKIGGLPVSDVLDTADTYFFFENEADRQFWYSALARHNVLLRRAGAEAAMLGSPAVLYLVDGDGETRTMEVRATTNLQEVMQAPPRLSFFIRHEMMGDVFFIDLRTFVDGEHIDRAVKAIEEAVENGVRKFIVDLRGNGGGDSWAGQRLLEAMGITVPTFGAVRRVSELAIQQRDNFTWGLENPDAEFFRFSPSTDSAENPNDVFVSVLTDVHTYSSANMFGVWVQDGKFGNIIGSPSRNSPSNFGDMLWFQLPFSLINVSVSYTRWLRPDPYADQFTLVPDIPVPAENALETALEYLRGM